MVIHSSSAHVNPGCKPRFVVQVFDRKGAFCSNHGFPQRAGVRWPGADDRLTNKQMIQRRPQRDPISEHPAPAVCNLRQALRGP
jgi:hypothetical protein